MASSVPGRRPGTTWMRLAAARPLAHVRRADRRRSSRRALLVPEALLVQRLDRRPDAENGEQQRRSAAVHHVA
eukprot:CAMPEP_0195127732 /NCGR_PEP_ID=MMETSP0448-20130528/137641_1 /TAXON_ID=66468 /ORGANISM="Heterocapsa triquestra, Strain CCMP 448" /LENGTH=72 /DNA_ID=CAMNT_0040165493 /DNA_START=531 /DNA_END=746 /DNA_ORIENTATION=-